MKVNHQIPMKTLTAIIFLFLSTYCYGQRPMAVSENLLSNGSAYPVTWKGISSFPKFQFHTYQVVEGKTGWTKSKYNSRLFSRLETASSNHKGSYLMASQAGDSAVVNFSRNMDFKGLESAGIVFGGENSVWSIGVPAEVINSLDNYVALIETTSADSAWRLIVTEQFGTQFGASFFGWLTNGDQRIDIRPVFNYQEGKKKGIIELMTIEEVALKGFEFFENARAIGAVQLGPQKKQFTVWFANDLDSQTEFIVAISCAGLLRDYMNTMD